MVSVVVEAVAVTEAEGCPGTGIGTALGAGADAGASAAGVDVAAGTETEEEARAARRTLYSRVEPAGGRDSAVGDIGIEAGEATLGDARDS